MEEIKKIEVQGHQYGVADMLMRSVMGGNAQVIEWSHTHNMNDYKEAGTYRIKGERTGNPMDDNLPIMNQGSGHTIDGILYVLDSSLANGSGNVDDCTITQFLILSNRVGGQEGDMYMRSGYGPSKDDVLAWKPWEKYQTNMEVGVVSDGYALNPSNPTQAISDKGMKELRDNGIYSGIYFPPKAMIGTPGMSAVIRDATAIETFVMVVINNYAAAGDARCITQIKFAVTNGGVFSMEKRIATSEYGWSTWESVGGGTEGGLPDGVSISIPKENNGFIIEGNDNTLTLGSGVLTITGDDETRIQPGVYLGVDVKVGNKTNIGEYVNMISGIQMGTAYKEGGLLITGSPGNISVGNDVEIGQGVYIADGIALYCHPNELNLSGLIIGADGNGTRISSLDSDFIFYYGWSEGPIKEGDYYGKTTINAEFGYIKFESSEGNKSIEITDDGLRISKGESTSIIGKNVTIPDNLSFSIADNILTITDGTKTWKLTAES